MRTDQKSRNAYKRYWRNKRNMRAAEAAAFKLLYQADRSFDLMSAAAQEMEDAR